MGKRKLRMTEELFTEMWAYGTIHDELVVLQGLPAGATMVSANVDYEMDETVLDVVYEHPMWEDVGDKPLPIIDIEVTKFNR